MQVSGQLHAMAALLKWENPAYPLFRKQGGAQSWSGRCRENLPIQGIEPRFLGPTHSLVAISTELPRTI
jgi:hypothetical protein